MDDKDDPYSQSYQPKPALPPFSSLRPCSSILEGCYGTSEADSGYGSSLLPYHQQQQLYTFNSYQQGRPSHFHQQSLSTDFPIQTSPGGLQRNNQASQFSNYHPSSFHGNTSQGSHNFQVKDQQHLLGILQHPPIPDMSLSLPFSSGQPGMHGSSHLPIGIQNLSGGHIFRSNADHPPQIPLSQVESLLSEVEQKSVSDFSALPQTIENHDRSSSWQPSHNSVSTPSSEQLPSFSSFSSFYSNTSGTLPDTKNMHLTSELQGKINSYDNRFRIPESSNFTGPTTSLPGYASQYQSSENSYSGNCFLPKHTSIMNSGSVTFSNFRTGEQDTTVHTTLLTSQAGYRNKQQDSDSVVTEQAVAMTKGSKRGKKNRKKVAEKSLDVEVKSLMKKKKPRTLKKAKCHASQESLVLQPIKMNSDTDSVSPPFCLSPTFIASLSSKRAPVPDRCDDPCETVNHAQQNCIPQRSYSSHVGHNTSQSYHVQQDPDDGFITPAHQNTLAVSTNNQFLNAITSQMSYSPVSFPPAMSLCQRSNSKHELQIFNQQINPSHIPNIQTECKPNKNKYNKTQKRETEEEENSMSPFQLSPGFLASLSSRRAEDHHVHKSLMTKASIMEPSLDPHNKPLSGVRSGSKSHHEDHHVHTSLMAKASVMKPSLDSHNKPLSEVRCDSKYQFPMQPEQTSLSLPVQPAQVSFAHSELPYSIYPSSSVKQVVSSSQFDRPEACSSWNSFFQKSSSQECNFKNLSRQAGSSCKQYVLPPDYPQGSEFQYPTPPMDDDEKQLQSPGLCMSPKFLDSLSSKVASGGELSHRLSPSLDDNSPVLPTPPNSAGPKQPYMPDITLSKEEQTTRILEIIAREREKSSTTFQTSTLELKKRKKKKSNEVGNSGDEQKSSSSQFPRQMEQHILPYCSESPVDNDNSFQKYPEVPGSLSDHTSCFGKTNNYTVSPDTKGTEASLNYHCYPKEQQLILPENNCKKFNSEEESPKVEFFRIDDTCNRNETLQRHIDKLQAVEGQNHTSMSPKFDVISSNNHVYRTTHAGTSQDPSAVSHFPIRKPDFTHAPKLLDKELVKTDPYAFDDSEQMDLNVSLTRSMKMVPNMPYTAQTKLLDRTHISHSRSTTKSVSQDIPVSKVPFTAETKHLDNLRIQSPHHPFYSADSNMSYSKHFVAAEKVQTNIPSNPPQISWDKISSHQRNHQRKSNKMFIKSEPLASQPHGQEFNSNIKQQHHNQHSLNEINNTTAIFNDNHYQHRQQVQQQKSLENTGGVLFGSEGAVIKQEPHSMQEITDYNKILQNSFSTMNGHVSDMVKHEINESVALDSVKKRRGRPPKHTSSTTCSPVRPKVPKFKLHEKKSKVPTPKKLVYMLNGAEVNSSDLNLNQNLVDRLANNLVEVADCSCLGPDHIPSESTEGPYYTQLGAAKDIPGVRKVLEQRTGLIGSAIRIEKVIYTGKEGKSKEGCPIAKWIIRRSGPDEKYLCIVRKRPGHFCDTAVIIMVIVAWEGVDRQQADTLYDFLISTLPQNGLETDRRCGLNEKKTCACQGVDLLRRGASFSFGCSWSMYYNGCKFARSQMARKFKLKDADCEDELEDKLQKLATDVAPLYSQLAPDAFRNQVQFEKQAYDCRLGRQPGRPFSGVTAVVDFCCHSHRDCHNMNNGSTVVVNLTKHRGFEKPEDEQYHVLPLYILDQTDELGTMEGQMTKVRNGSLEVLSSYMSQVRRRSIPYRPCQRNRTISKKQGLKKGPKKSKLVKAKSFPSGDCPDEISSKHEGNSLREDRFLLPESPSLDKMVPGVGLDERNQESMSYTDLMSQQGTPGFGDLYAKFWDYFYTHGEFPPCEWMPKKKISSKAMRSFALDTLIQPNVADQIFLHRQQQQQQEQRRQQQHNVPAGQSQQHEQHKQQNLSSFTGKINVHSPSLSPQSLYSHMSPRQQHNSHSYQCETSIPKTSPVTPHQGSVLHKRQSCIPTPLPSSIPLISPKLQHQHSSESPTPLDQSHSISSTSHNQSLEANNINMQSLNYHNDHTNEENSMSIHFSSQNSSNCSQSTALVSHVPPSSCNEHSVKPPPPYHQSISNQHNMQCGPQEALCSFKPQGLLPPSYCESLAQNVHNNIIQVNDSQGDICISRYSSNHSRDGPQLQSFNQSVQYPASASSAQHERQAFLPGVQRSTICSALLEKPPAEPRSPSELPRSLSVSSEGLSSEIQRPQSALSSGQSMAMQSSQSIQNNSCVQSISYHTSMQQPCEPELVQSVQRPPGGPHAAQQVQSSSSGVSVPKPSSEQSVPRLLSSQFLTRRQPLHSVDGLQLAQRGFSHSAEISSSQSVTTSGPWCINRQQLGAEYNDSVTHLNSSSMSDTLTFSLDDKQVKVGTERCWSRMSEPSSVAEIARPSSCSSEPGLFSGCKKELPFNVTSANIQRGKRTWSCAGTDSLHPRLNNLSGVNSDYTHAPQGGQNAEIKEFGTKYESSNKIEPISFAHSGMIKTCGSNNLQQSYVQIKERNSSEVNFSGLFVNGSVCPNGPVIGEKMKVHKSEGFVVPKLGQGPSEPPYEVIDSTVASEEIDDNLEAFSDPAMGGVAIALCHGAVLFEVAKRELHATTALKEPNRYQPKRISLVFYQHKNLNMTRHGFDEYERKIEERRNQAEQARLIEEMESKGFLKGELSELATFPNLTKGTFGKVFNFPESRETLFPLRFPRYLDLSHSEQITPVMYACMSIAFPKYMKEAFPNPSKLPQLISGHMPCKMHSSLSDKRKEFKLTPEMDGKELQFLVNNSDKCERAFEGILCPWNPNIPQGHTLTTDRVITRWVHDDVSVTGPYNRWVELTLQDSIKKEEMEVEAESEADLKEKMFESLSQLDHEAYISNGNICSDSFKNTETIMKTCRGNLDMPATTMVVDLEPAVELHHSDFSSMLSKNAIKLKQFSHDKLEHIEASKGISIMPMVCSDHVESYRSINSRLESTDYNKYSQQELLGSRLQLDPTHNSVLDNKSKATENTVNITPQQDTDTSLRNGPEVPDPRHNIQVHGAHVSNNMSTSTTTDIDQLNSLARIDTSSIYNCPIRKSNAKDDNRNCSENDEAECQLHTKNDIPRCVSVLGDPACPSQRKNYTSEVEHKFEENVCSPVTKRQENVYDFLMKGFSRSFLSDQPNDAQVTPGELTSALTNVSKINKISARSDSFQPTHKPGFNMSLEIEPKQGSETF